MIIKINDWIMEVDITATMIDSCKQSHDHCLCGYCRNYYAAIDSFYPELRTFLAQFGLSIDGPDELSPYEPTIYEASYIIYGSILQRGSHPICVNGIPVRILESSDIRPISKYPFFVLEAGLIELPWILDEDVTEVISPANEPEYIDRMQKKLLRYMSDCFTS